MHFVTLCKVIEYLILKINPLLVYVRMENQYQSEIYYILLIAATNLQLPDHMELQNGLESASFSSQPPEEPRPDPTKTDDPLKCSKVIDPENTTSSSDEEDLSTNEKEHEIKRIQDPLLQSTSNTNSFEPYLEKDSQKSLTNIVDPNLGEPINKNKKLPIVNENGCETKITSNGCYSPNWLVLLGALFYFFSQGVDGFFQSQTYSFALCGPLKLEANMASYINFAFFSSYCLGRIILIPISQKVHPSVIIISALTLCCLSSAFLSLFGGMSLEALLAGNAVMGLSISFQFPSGLTWLASEMPGGMKSIYTSFMFTGANFGWIVLTPLASTLFYVISPSAPFVTALICNLLHMIVFFAMYRTSKYLRKLL